MTLRGGPTGWVSIFSLALRAPSLIRARRSRREGDLAQQRVPNPFSMLSGVPDDRAGGSVLTAGGQAAEKAAGRAAMAHHSRAARELVVRHQPPSGAAARHLLASRGG